MNSDNPGTNTMAAVAEYPLYTQASDEHAAGNIEKALKLLREHLSESPDHSEAWNDLGIIVYEQGDLEEAIRFFGKAIVADPTNGTAFENLVEAYARAERYTEAALLATRWSECVPESSAPWIVLAKLNLMANNIQGAKEALAQARCAAPEDKFIVEAIGLLNADPSPQGQECHAQ